MIRSLVCMCWLGAVLAAQQPQTYIVDAANGPGAQFTDITAAAAAVLDGSILRVRPGWYAPVVVDGKGLTILCDSGVIAGSPTGSTPFLLIRNTQPGQIVAVSGLVWGGGSGLHVLDAAGPVWIDGRGRPISTGDFRPACVILRSRQVVVRAYWMSGEPGCVVEDSVAVFESCQMNGVNGYPYGKPGGGVMGVAPGLDALRSDVQLAHCSVFGGHGAQNLFIRPGAPAAQLESSNLRVLGLSSHPLTGGNTPASTPQQAILGTGTARVEPQIPMTGTPPAGPGITLTRPTMPSLLSQDSAPGGMLVVQRYGAPGSVFVVALGLPGPIATLPGIVDPLWFDPLRYGIESVGVGPAIGPVVIQRPVPNQPFLRGVNFVWQSADLHATGVVELSNPSPTVIR